MIAIAGGSGSGKTTILNMLVERCQELNINITALNQDNYYSDLSRLTMKERKQTNFDDPHSLDFDLLFSHISLLAKGEKILRPTYDFASHTRVEPSVEVVPSDVVIFDGIFALHYARLIDVFDLRIFVDVDDDLRFIRRLQRDTKERGRTIEGVIEQYLATVRPMHKKFIAPSKSHADLVINWENISWQPVESILGLIQHHLGQRG